MKIQTIITLCFAMVFTAVVYSEQAFEVIWSKPVATPDYDVGNDVAVNSLGQSIIVGETEGAFVNYHGAFDAYFLEFKSDGTLLQTSQFGTANFDGYFGVAVDSMDNVFLAGNADNNAILEKYDAMGVFVWSKSLMIVGTTYHNDVAVDLDDNIYVAGFTNDTNNRVNATVAKYSNDGTLIWSRVVADASSTVQNSRSNAVVVDSNGDIYITGGTFGDVAGTNAGAEDIFIIKYDPSGQVIWSRQLGTTFHDKGNGITVSSTGVVYVAGSTYGDLGGVVNNGGGDAFIAKYSPTGGLVWIKLFGSSENEDGNDVAIGSDDNIYLIGGTEGSLDGSVVGAAGDQYVTKFNPAGEVLWIKQINTPVYDFAYGLSIENNGGPLNTDAVFIAGTDYTSGLIDGILTKLSLLDTDGDGLLDNWEISGIPYFDNSGVEQHYMLAGADPMHKDLYVEMDIMCSSHFSATSVSLIQNAFSSAPLTNPDGNDGVNLHVTIDNHSMTSIPIWQTDGCWPLDFDSIRLLNFGTSEERNDASHSSLLSAKAKAYRYAIAADKAAPKDIGGCGQISGDNLVMFFGNGTYNDLERAAVLMHELGHNLGLHHGGIDDINGKSNYPSIMNYILSYKMNWNSLFWNLDYSREAANSLVSLSENSLDETLGIGTSNGYYKDYFMPYGVTLSGTTDRAVKYVRLNGTATDFGDTTQTFTQDQSFDDGVVQDLNYVVNGSVVSLPTSASLGDAFISSNDWNKVRLALSAAMGTSAVTISYPNDELTNTARMWMEANFPIPFDNTGDVIFKSGYE